MSKPPVSTLDDRPKTLLFCAYTSDNKIHDMEAYYEEFLSLVKTLGTPYDATLLWKLRATDVSHFLTKGKMLELKEFCDHNEIEEIICSKELTPLQERTMSDALDCKVFDRTQLILEIFHNSAKTAEGKTQVEIADLEYLKTRIVGRGKELAQQAGYVGTKGPGETEAETLRRYYATKVRQAKKKLHTLEKTREIGVMKAIGAKNSHIMYLVLIEAGLYGLGGGLVGVLIGIGLAKLTELIFILAVGPAFLLIEIDMFLIIGTLLFSFIVGCLSGLAPARKASKLNPVDALRYE